MLSRLQHSLSAKLLALFVCAGAILLLLVGSIMGKGFSSHVKSGIEPFMINYIELMQQQLGSPPNRDSAELITKNSPVNIHVFSDQTQWTTSSVLLDRRSLAESKSSSIHGSNRYKLHRKGTQIILETRDGDYTIYFQISESSNSEQGTRYSLIVLLLILGILVLIYFLTRSIFSPIEDIEKGVKLYGEGNLSHKIPKRRNDQLGDLIDSVNYMAEDISQMLEAKRQFLLGISHELRSPLTRCKVNLALMEDSTRNTEINNDIKAMDNLIGELLESERLNSPHRVIQPEETNIENLVEELIKSEFSDGRIELNLEPVIAAIDPARVRLLLRNILQNAIKYNIQLDSKNPSPKIQLKQTSNSFSLSIRDFGSGVAKEHIPFLTEPFYRADPSRQRLTGGYGLGLYLCKMIMKAHSGQIRIDSELGKGTKITCRFPTS